MENIPKWAIIYNGRRIYYASSIKAASGFAKLFRANYSPQFTDPPFEFEKDVLLINFKEIQSYEK